MKLLYTRRAATELDEILTWITERSPQGAARVQQRIHETIEILRDHPNAGRLTSLENVRRVITHPYPYLVYYSVEPDAVIVLGVRHASRLPIE